MTEQSERRKPDLPCQPKVRLASVLFANLTSLAVEKRIHSACGRKDELVAKPESEIHRLRHSAAGRSFTDQPASQSNSQMRNAT